MPQLRSMFVEFANDLHDLSGLRTTIAIDVGLGRGEMRPWEFDELAQIFQEMFPDAPPLKCAPISRCRRR